MYIFIYLFIYYNYLYIYIYLIYIYIYIFFWWPRKTRFVSKWWYLQYFTHILVSRCWELLLRGTTYLYISLYIYIYIYLYSCIETNSVSLLWSISIPFLIQLTFDAPALPRWVADKDGESSCAIHVAKTCTSSRWWKCGTPFNATFTCVLVHMVNGTTRARRGCNPCSRRLCRETTISIGRWPCWWRRSSPKPGSHQRCCPGPRYVIRFILRFIIGHGHWVQGTKSADEVDLQNNELFPCVSFQKRRWRKRITTLRLCRQTSRTSLCKHSITDAFFCPGCWRTKVMGQFEIEVCIKWMCTATIPTRQNFPMCQKNGLILILLLPTHHGCQKSKRARDTGTWSKLEPARQQTPIAKIMPIN